MRTDRALCPGTSQEDDRVTGLTGPGRWWGTPGPFTPPLLPALGTISVRTVRIHITTLSDLGLFLTVGLERFSVSRVMVWVLLRLPCEPCPWAPGTWPRGGRVGGARDGRVSSAHCGVTGAQCGEDSSTTSTRDATAVLPSGGRGKGGCGGLINTKIKLFGNYRIPAHH